MLRPAAPGGFAPAWPVWFVGLGCVWGCSFLLMKVADGSLSAVEVAFGREAIGAVSLLAIVVAYRERLPPPGRVWLHLAIAALLLNVGPYTLFAQGERTVPSAVAGFFHGASPLVSTLLVVLMAPAERFTRLRVAGLALGFGGVCVLVSADGSAAGRVSGAGTACCALAAITYGAGSPYARAKLTGRPHSALALTAGMLVCGTVELAVLAAATTRRPPEPTSVAIAAVAVLGVVGTGLASAVNIALVRAVGAATAASVIYLVTACSALLGVMVGKEAVGWRQPTGGAVIIAGVILGARAAPRPPTPLVPVSVPEPVPVPEPPAGERPPAGTPAAHPREVPL